MDQMSVDIGGRQIFESENDPMLVQSITGFKHIFFG
jgi:hypothetical protein